MADLTERELDVMSVLWDAGSGTVVEVRERLPDALAYTTVLSILRIMERKRFVRHEEEGKAHRYFPLVAREEAGSYGIQRLIDKVFAGSTDALLSHLVRDEHLTGKRLTTLRKMVDDRLKRGRVK
ncbi:MAG: BlaI/MecI/CopY family transcriptional regulator [bacterium]